MVRLEGLGFLSGGDRPEVMHEGFSDFQSSTIDSAMPLPHFAPPRHFSELDIRLGSYGVKAARRVYDSLCDV